MLSQALSEWVAQGQSSSENRTEAKRLIERCFDRGDAYLSLCGLQLTRLPDCLGQLRRLNQLDLGSNRLADLPSSLGCLTALRMLDVQGNQLSRLPDVIPDLTRLTSLNLSANRLQVLPESIGRLQQLRSLNLSNNQLARLPEAVLQLSTSFRFCQVQVNNNPLEGEAHQRMSALQYETTGIAVLLPPAAQVILPPGPQLARWYADLGLPLEPRAWHDDTSPEAVNFGRCLEDLFMTEDYALPHTRDAFKERVKNILVAIEENGALRERIFAEALSATGSCQDATAVGFSRMDLALQDHRAATGELSAADVFNIGRGKFRLHLMEEVAKPLTREAQDPVEVWLDLLISLKQPLSLPVASERMHHHSDLSQDIRDRVKQAVLDRENAVPAGSALKEVRQRLDIGQENLVHMAKPLPKNALAHYLATEHTPWASQVERAAPRVVEEFKNRASKLQEAIEDAVQKGALSDEQYILACRGTQFLHNHGAAYIRALEAIVERQGNKPESPQS